MLGEAAASRASAPGFVLNGTARSPPTRTSSRRARAPTSSSAREVFVEFADGNQVAAKIVGYDPNADVALLKVDPRA